MSADASVGADESVSASAVVDDFEMDELTRKIIVGFSNACKRFVVFSTIRGPEDTPKKITDLFSTCLDIEPSAFSVEVKGNKAFINVSQECIPFVIANFFGKATVFEDKSLGEFLEVRIDSDEGKFYRFRISSNQGGVRSFEGGQNRDGEGRGRGRGRGRGNSRGRGSSYGRGMGRDNQY